MFWGDRNHEREHATHHRGIEKDICKNNIHF